MEKSRAGAWATWASSAARILVAASVALLAVGACGGDASDAGEHDASVEARWPSYDEAQCAEAGWMWFRDRVQPYCPGGDCQARVAQCFCALQCASDADCAGTTTPHCGHVMVYNLRDSAYCGGHRVCTPRPDGRSYLGCSLPPVVPCGDDVDTPDVVGADSHGDVAEGGGDVAEDAATGDNASDAGGGE